MAIAMQARVSQIGESTCATMLLGDDVLDLEGDALRGFG
jgi:hypothetical protein